MALFFKKLIRFSLLFLITGIVMGSLLDGIFKKDKTDKVTWINQLNDQQYDYAFLGSSRVANMTDTRILNQITGSNGINLGVGGADLRLNYLNLEVFLSHGNKVKEIFLQVDPFGLYTNDQYNVPAYDHYFLGYQYLQPVSRSLKEHQSKSSLLLNRVFPAIRYMEYNEVYKLTSLVRSLGGSGGQDITLGFEGVGSSALEQIQDNWEELVYTQESLQNRAYLERIITLCDTQNISLTLYSAPILNYQSYLSPKYPNFVSGMKQLCNENKLRYVNLMQEDSLNELILWKDMIHLNLAGVDRYSRLLASRLFDQKTQQAP